MLVKNLKNLSTMSLKQLTAAKSSTTTTKMMHYVFRRVTQLEWMFWDSAYQMQSWPV